jgi:sugar (pentulose or hexulose) kinase
MKTVKKEFVIGLDCSTTSVKAIAFNKKGKIAGKAVETIPLYSPQLNYYEQNANEWWTSAKKALKNLTGQINPNKIAALAISNQRETFVTLDKNGKFLRPAIVWLDERCKDEVEPFSRVIGKEKIHSLTGKPVDYAPVVYRLAWMKKNEPSLFRNISMICDVHAFLVWKLTGAFKTSTASADPLGLFDLKNKIWSAKILNALELKPAQLPHTFPPGSVLEQISQKAARLTGLSTGTLIIAGGGDGQAGGLGSNVLTSKKSYLNLGTAVVAGVYHQNYNTNKAYRTMNSCSSEGYYLECSLRAGTFALDWFIKKVLNVDTTKQPDIYRILEKEASQIPIGCGSVMHLPYLCGVMNPYWDINARGAFIGLSSSHTRAHLYRAVLEGIAFEQLFTLNKVEKNIDSRIKDLIVIGGGSSSKLWLQIMADVTGKNICLPKNSEASALGAAICASVGSGLHNNFQTAANIMTGIKKIIKPNPANSRKYKYVFSSYIKIYSALKDLK